jgi:hypothetical protein
MPPQARIFEAIVWVGDGPGQRLTLEAKDYDEVTDYLREKFGPDAVFTISTKEDADRIR